MPKLNKPIFIIAMHRTGSTLLKNILNNNSKVSMATDEMHIAAPFGKRFYEHYYSFKNLQDDIILKEFINFIFKANIYGTFWKEYKELGINKEVIFNELKKTDRSLEAVISVLLNEYRKLNNKPRVGVKYPLHFSKIELLYKWYPDAKIILLHRDIRAVCASKLNDEATRRRKKYFGFIIHYITLFAFIIEYIWMGYFYKKNKHKLYKINYEDLILNPENELKKLCIFSEIPFEQDMLIADGKESSHSEKNSKGIDESRLKSWKKKLTPFDTKLIKFLTQSTTKEFK